MRAECIQAVVNAIGRSITQAEVKGIENRINQHHKRLAQDTPSWMAMSKADRLREAAKSAADEITREAKLKKWRTALTILAHDRVKNYVDSSTDTPVNALGRLIAFDSDQKSGVLSVESQAKAIRDIAYSQMLTLIDTTKGKFLSLLSDPESSKAVIKELHGEPSGIAAAKQSAKEFKDVAETLRQRFNNSGGAIGRLESWAMPRSHSQLKVAKNREAWIDDHVKWADRRSYVNEDGSRMSDAQLREFFTHAAQTIATGGINKVELGRFAGGSLRANHGSESRSIHYKDADSFILAQQKYGDKDLLALLTGHIDRLARDIALTETLGPNSDLQFRTQMDMAQQSMVNADPAKAKKIESEMLRVERLYKDVAGQNDIPETPWLKEAFDTYRSINVASKLGSAAITAITDQGNLMVTAKVNNLPVMQVFAQEMKLLNPADSASREAARRAGLGINYYLNGLQRFGAETLGSAGDTSGALSSSAQKIAGFVLRASGLNAMTSAGNQAFGMVMLDTIGGMTRKHASLALLNAKDRTRLQGMGVTEADWAVWRKADVSDLSGMGDTVLTHNEILALSDSALTPLAKQFATPPAKLRNTAATKLLGVVQDEAQMAVVEPGARERVTLHRGTTRGTWSGEIWRSATQFKSFPIAMVMRHAHRALAQDGAGKGTYAAAIIAASTLLGGMAIQLNEIASGRDPRDMSKPEFWGGAFLKGGALGLYGDFLLTNQTQGGNSFIASIGGPLAGDIESVVKMTQGAAFKAIDGKDPHTAANVVRFIKGHTPGANLWYAKAALDHMIFHDIQEQFSPGYLSRMRQRAQKEYDQQFWWAPGETAPDRAPDLGAAFGD
ncbi:hypothetical protein FG435_001870 [Yersinia enterocolitica]|nr:hypothetical protein [Yersinia enterocolitica]EKN4897691.1 hypothetical protein [Yersinia enterocolitica]